MTQGKKMPAGAGNAWRADARVDVQSDYSTFSRPLAGKRAPAERRADAGVRGFWRREFATQLGTFRPCDVALLGAALLTAYAVCSGVLYIGYLIAKGTLF